MEDILSGVVGKFVYGNWFSICDFGVDQRTNLIILRPVSSAFADNRWYLYDLPDFYSPGRATASPTPICGSPRQFVRRPCAYFITFRISCPKINVHGIYTHTPTYRKLHGNSDQIKKNSQNKKQAKATNKIQKGKYEMGKPWKSVANLEAIFE